jgi:23S rRNA (uridine2552-2'-O)-methyltransferase|tara:strand:- start:163 stop:780 length:618 start_codon:yes stop_codon:yes gene_type:complete
MKKNKSSKSWIIKQHRDPFFKKSKTLGYRSRSAFKLIELNEKFKFIKNNSNLLDIGSSPGGWSQIASSIIKNGKIVAVDKKPMKEVKNVIFFQKDFTDNELQKEIKKTFGGKIDIVVSDMASETTGNKSLDCIRTNLLCSEVINFSISILKQRGILVSKVFMGEDFLEIRELAKKKFKNVEFYKPKSSRSESKETYIHCETLNTL